MHASTAAPVRGLSAQVRRHPLASAALLATAGSLVGYTCAAVTSGKVAETLLVASTTLLFGALLGGVVKLLLDDVQRVRERRSEQTGFVRAVLDDLKSVYDRVERVRVLVAAHQSARTYGNEMRDLIDAAVQLRNVKRALDQSTSGLRDEDRREGVVLAVDSMESYLSGLTGEFRDRYKTIADKQRIYEAEFDRMLLEETYLPTPPTNPAWQEIHTLPMLGEFRRAESHPVAAGAQSTTKHPTTTRTA